MAIQSFSVGQVLTAAQVNALQANDYNQTVSNKTGSYTLVAADKGTRITISSTSATTITVNNSLFSAGDTLFIQNLNSGVSTITAGTATVTTASSLALAQWEGGTLYFTSASAAIFFKSDGAAASGGGMTLISTTTLSGGTTTISVSANSYKDLTCYITGVSANADVEVRLQINGISGASDYTSVLNATQNTSNQSLYQQTNNARLNAADGTGSGSDFVSYVLLKDANSTKRKVIIVSTGHLHAASGRVQVMDNVVTVGSTTVVSSIEITAVSASFTGGTVLLYGVA